MKTIATLFIAYLAISITSCKKGYTCSCSSEDGFYDGFDIHDSKKRAQKKCNDYALQYDGHNHTQYDSIPTSPIHCELLKGE